ncbi:MAG TPA: OmpA family protein [Cyclobacteriaceae bacterium]|jgi:OOP family OmpA-OmpF porin|nr:OmpA family protein [Cyclobacteriaceae bacterium]HNT49102.1 OmpA family protein [Cyclobacteriaceae bacterium]HRE65277.1 OmpA family protein [Cyclobacteriaceae bacterium]HRF34852.1 OmpA family protein [Cyclobacteriaceae bacterium]
MKVLFLVLFSCFASAVFAQVDTLIYAHGNITSAATKEPVVARISYQSLPYGSKVGFFSGSSFSFPLFDNEKYSITVEASGYAPSKYILDPAEANDERKVLRNIELNLPSGASNNAESSHTVGKVMRLNNLNFDAGRSVISSSSFSELDEVVLMLKKNPRMVIQLEGHTDTRGNANANLALSEERVKAVKSYLASKGGSKSRIKTKAFGGSMPISREDTEASHALNRRVELRILDN